MGGGDEHYLSRTCTYGPRELIKDLAPATSAAALGILLSQAPRGQEGSPSPCGCLADLLSVFPFKERLCKDKSFKAKAQLPIKVARLADLHGDHRSTAVPSHFPGRVSALSLQCLGLELSLGEDLPEGRSPGWVPAHGEDKKEVSLCSPQETGSSGDRADGLGTECP